MALKLGKCRLCLKLGDFYSIFSTDSNTNLAEMAMACAQIKVDEGDGLPDKVCGECVEKLSSAYIFKEQCERSDQVLRRNYVPPPGFNPTPPPPNRQSSDSGYSNRTEVSYQAQSTSQLEDIPLDTASTSKRKRKRRSDEPTKKSLLQESLSFNVSSPSESDLSRPKTPDKRARYDQDSDYEPFRDVDSNDSIHTCDSCDRSFPTYRSLKLHQRIHTKEKLVEKQTVKANMCTDVVVNIPTPPVVSPPLGHKCDICGKNFKLHIMLKRHMEQCNKSTPADKIVCLKCNVKFESVNELEEHKRSTMCSKSISSNTASVSSAQVNCLFCETPIRDYRCYLDHHATCSSRKELVYYQCPNCISRFNRKGNYLTHLREKHFAPDKSTSKESAAVEADELFECRVCSKKLADQDQLVTHLAAHMSNIDPESSDQGGADRSRSSTPLTNTTEANGSNEHRCQFCDKLFTYKKSLQSHILAKHTGEQAEQVKREVNEESFSSDDDGETGADNTCHICDKEFSYKRVYLQHMATKHTRVAGYKKSTVQFNKCQVKCLHCNVTMLAADIKAHNLVHINANIRPKSIYTCYECKATCKGSDGLRTHIMMVHRLNLPDTSNKGYEVTDVANFCEVVVTKSEPTDELPGHNDLKLESVPGLALDGVKAVVDMSGFTCPICNKKMPTLVSLKRHVNWHSNMGNNLEKTLQCEICDLKFKFKKHHRLHMRDHYHDTTLDPKFLTCKICNRKSKHLRAAQMHSKWHEQTRFNNKDYQCSICKKVFQYRKLYLSHMAVHYKKGDSIEKIQNLTEGTPSPVDGEYKCPHCQKVLESAMSLKCHVSWHTSKSALYGSRYECEICHTQFTNKRRKELHMRTHYEDEAGPHFCPNCGKGYNNEEHFNKHVKSHNFDNQSQAKRRQRLRELRQKKVQCPICCRYYPDLLHLVRHIRRAHPQSKMIKEDPDAEPAKVFPCKLCAKVFLDEKRLQFHEEAHLRKPVHYRCKFCNRKNISLKLHNVHVKGHLTAKHSEPLECTHCGERFVRGYDLHHHLRDRHGVHETWATETPLERPIGPLQQFQCVLCYKVLTNRGYYERHIDYHNTLRCNYCFEFFNTKVFLDGHLGFSCDKRKLIGDTEPHLRKLKCSECFKAFHVQVKLDCHMWTNHGVREFQQSVSSKSSLVCDFCFRVFDNVDALTGHKLYHRTVLFYGCLYCKRKFSNVTSYNKHKNHHLSQMCTDNPVKCEHCDETFGWFRDMIYHMRDVHGDDKEWITTPKESIEEECNICKKRFYNLQRHLSYHEQNRCRKCKEYFYSRSDFDSHLCDIISEDEGETAAPQGTVIKYGECAFCFKQTSRKSSQKLHDALHNQSGSFSCRICPSKFKTIETFNIHKFSHHSKKFKKNPLVCPVCRENFIQYGPFMRHIKNAHQLKLKLHYKPMVRPEPCVVCQRSLPNLHNHYRAHLDAQCAGCRKYFTSRTLFAAHVCDQQDTDPSKVFTSDADLLQLINSYVPKDMDGEIIFYGKTLTEEEIAIQEAKEEEEKKRRLQQSEATPVISAITSLKSPVRASEVSDDDCVMVDEPERQRPAAIAPGELICIDDDD